MFPFPLQGNSSFILIRNRIPCQLSACLSAKVSPVTAVSPLRSVSVLLSSLSAAAQHPVDLQPEDASFTFRAIPSVLLRFIRKQQLFSLCFCFFTSPDGSTGKVRPRGCREASALQPRGGNYRSCVTSWDPYLTSENSMRWIVAAASDTERPTFNVYQQTSSWSSWSTCLMQWFSTHDLQ